MRFSWNEMRARAANFARDWAGEGYEKGQTQLFYRDFFDIFGVPVRPWRLLKSPCAISAPSEASSIFFGRAFCSSNKKAKVSILRKAKAQALHYFPGLKDAELPRFVMLSDFQSFELYDLEEDESVAFLLTDLPKHIATRPWREARSATAPTVSASFSECRPSGTHAVSDRVYSYAAQRAPCGESRCQPGRGQIRLFPEPARVGRRGRARSRP